MSIYLYVQPASRILRATQVRNNRTLLSSVQCATASPETKSRCQLRPINQVLEHLERANEKAYQGRDHPLHFRDRRVPAKVSQVVEVRN